MCLPPVAAVAPDVVQCGVLRLAHFGDIGVSNRSAQHRSVGLHPILYGHGVNERLLCAVSPTGRVSIYGRQEKDSSIPFVSTRSGVVNPSVYVP